MSALPSARSALWWLAAGVGLAGACYATLVALTWSNYGRARLPAGPEEEDPLLDRFVPEYDVETRVTTTDPAARAACRRYWSFVSPGVVLIRRLSLGLVKAEAESQARRVGLRLRSEAAGNAGG